MKSAELIRLLERHGFRRTDQTGSHVKMRNDAGVTLVVPVHKGKDIGVGLLYAILRQAGIDANIWKGKP